MAPKLRGNAESEEGEFPTQIVLLFDVRLGGGVPRPLGARLSTLRPPGVYIWAFNNSVLPHGAERVMESVPATELGVRPTAIWPASSVRTSAQALTESFQAIPFLGFYAPRTAKEVTSLINGLREPLATTGAIPCKTCGILHGGGAP